MADRTDAPIGRISSAEAALRLGVKIETVYAYVSRGYLSSHREAGHSSTFDPAEVESLRNAGKRDRVRNARPLQFPAISTTRLTATGNGRLNYRGYDALNLARTATFEEVVGLLWRGRLSPQLMQAPNAIRTAVRRLLNAAPPTTDTASRIRLSVTAAAAADPRRLDLTPPGVIRAGSTALACMLTAASACTASDGTVKARTAAVSNRPDDSGATVTDRLWSILTPADADARLRPCLQAALILLADHGLATCTVAARAAASARANPYAVISAGLASLEGPLYGAARVAAHHLLAHAHAHDTSDKGGLRVDFFSQHRQPDGQIPGFTTRTLADPRATTLLAALESCGAAVPVLDTITAIHDLVDPDHELKPTIELALGALATAASMPISATDTITSIARTAGWIAHALEEYGEPPLRWRAREIYTGPASDMS